VQGHLDGGRTRGQRDEGGLFEWCIISKHNIEIANGFDQAGLNRGSDTQGLNRSFYCREAREYAEWLSRAVGTSLLNRYYGLRLIIRKKKYRVGCVTRPTRFTRSHY
jgi:hypothetical protein